MRASAGGIERFMFWVGHGKDECTYELCDNTVDAEDVLQQTIQVFDGKGGHEEALVLGQEGSLNSSSFSLEWLGRQYRRLEKSRTNHLNEFIKLVAITSKHHIMESQIVHRV